MIVCLVQGTLMRSIRLPLLVAALAGTVVAVPAFAQQAVVYPPPCDASKVTKGDVDRAHAVFLSGKQYLDESNYDKAISYFNDAYSIDCSVHGILPVIATAYERKGDKAEAVRALQEYLRRAPTTSDREIIERRIKNLNDQLAREAPPPSAATAAPLPAPPPSASPPASTAPEPAPALVTPTSTVPDQVSHKGSSTLPWIVTGLGGAATITGVILYVVGAGDISSAENSCPSRSNCAPNVASQGNSGRSLETVGAIVGGVGLATAAAGIVWLVVQKPTASSAFLSPVVFPGYAGIAAGSTL
jgi:Tetratricopeptide repeat